MITFFRKIRKKMTDKNKPATYVRYAIGEIVLVVIGILIALQINNWNEERKINLREKSYLRNLQIDLTDDTSMLKDVVSDQLQYLERTKLLIALVSDYIPENIKIYDSIYNFQMKGNPTFFPNSGTYRSLILGGNLDMISSENLKGSLTNLYERYYERLEYNGKIFDQKILQFNQPRKIFIHNGFTEEALKDLSLLNGLLDEMEWRHAYIQRCKSTETELSKVLDLVAVNLNE
jgi:hypothetical protein